MPKLPERGCGAQKIARYPLNSLKKMDGEMVMEVNGEQFDEATSVSSKERR